MKRLVLSAFGIHTGGGLVLLRALLDAAAPHLRAAWLDSRLDAETWALAGSAATYPVPPTALARWRALDSCARCCGPEDVLLAFNSLPPRTRAAGRTILFIQNPMLLGAPISDFPLRTRVRLLLERALIRRGIGHADEVWVQNGTMAAWARSLFPGTSLRTMPLVPTPMAPGTPPEPPAAQARTARLLYPADSQPHKNHARLLAAWDMLAAEGLHPELWLTLPPSEVPAALPTIRALGSRPHKELLSIMADADAVIFPSWTESYGLPLVEAMALGKPLIASERDFVRDLAVPVQSFDPFSPRSIADAVRRFLGAPRLPTPPLSPAAFVAALLA